ncbi:hypothetical protein AAZR23_20580, partial [Morganella sp. Je.2.23]|uniref:hypothetical protein n=1 Tax=Morganella sp. Je.2.23 TaxID=3142840 RepID=UPI003DA9EA6D
MQTFIQKKFKLRKTILSIFIGGLCCATISARADCINTGINSEGGADIICDGAGSLFDTNSTHFVANNVVTVQGNNTTVQNDVYGAKSNSENVTDNSVIIRDGSQLSAAIGGGSVFGNVTNNTVIFNNSSRADWVYGGISNEGDAIGNIIIFNDNSWATNAFGGESGNNNATGNTVILTDSSYVNVVVAGNSNTGNATDNTVNIYDTAKVLNSLYGGRYYYSGAPSLINHDIFTGNTLNVAAAPFELSGEMANFEHYNFTVDPAHVNSDTALITADTIVFGTNEYNMNGGEANTSKIQVVGIKAGQELFADDKFVLMRATDTMSG